MLKKCSVSSEINFLKHRNIASCDQSNWAWEEPTDPGLEVVMVVGSAIVDIPTFNYLIPAKSFKSNIPDKFNYFLVNFGSLPLISPLVCE